MIDKIYSYNISMNSRYAMIVSFMNDGDVYFFNHLVSGKYESKYDILTVTRFPNSELSLLIIRGAIRSFMEILKKLSYHDKYASRIYNNIYLLYKRNQ